MKLFKAIAATACALAIATAAQATTYTDSSANYPDGWADGSNGGEGFGAWTIESHGSGDGWAGCGIWDPSANEFQGKWEGKTSAFGLMGKGQGFGVNAYRSFRAPLAPGDSFSLQMAVNWDSNAEGALKGFALSAKGGTHDIIVVNHGAYPGNIYINGDHSSEVLNATPEDGKPYPMTWTFTAKDETTLTITANSRADGTTMFEKDWEVSTSAIDSFRLQSSEQANENEDRRQSYYDNFVLDIAGELPDLVDLEFTSGEWAVTSASQELTYKLSRGSSADALDVTVTSSDESFVKGTTVSFAAGESEKEFTLDATLTGSGNFAKLTASATGCDPDTFEVKGPQYRMSVASYLVNPDEDVNFWINWDNNGIRDDSKVTIAADPDGSLELPTEWNWTEEEGGAYVASSFKAISSGTLILKYDGVQFADYGVTVRSAGFALSGPQSVKTGQTHSYSLTATLFDTEPDCTVSFDPADAASADPATFELIDPEEDGYTYKQEIKVTFGTTAGPVKLTVSSGSGNYSAELPITVTEPVNPADFDKYVAYDDASLYDGSFDLSSTGAGSVGFDPWSVVKSSAEFGGVVIDAGDGGFPAILSDGAAFALYANGNDPDYSVLRPFADGASLAPGQKVSIEFVASDASGSRFVQFGRIWDGALYNRFEIWNSGGAIGINIDGVESAINWSNGIRRVVASIELEADSSAYNLSLAGYDEGSEFVSDIYQHSINADVASWGDGIQGILIGAYDSGANFVFNKLAIEQVKEPVKVRAIGFSEATWNPDVADTPYKFAIGANTDDIGVVALSVTPDDGGIVLSTDSVDLTGITEAEFTVTVSAAAIPEEGEGTKYTITATPADTTVEAATYGVTPRAPYIYLTSDNWEYNDDQGAIWVTVHATPSHFGSYYVTIDPEEGVLSIPELSQIFEVNAANQNSCAFDLQVIGPGEVDVAIAHEGALEPSANYHFVIHESPDVEPVVLDKDVITFEKGSMTFKVPEGGTIMTTTNLVTGPWVAYPAEVGEDGAVVIPATGDAAFFRIGEPPAAVVVDGEGE